MHWEIEQSLPLEEEVQDSIVVTHLPRELEELDPFVEDHGVMEEPTEVVALQEVLAVVQEERRLPMEQEELVEA
jgi:hypothetical protein